MAETKPERIINVQGNYIETQINNYGNTQSSAGAVMPPKQAKSKQADGKPKPKILTAPDKEHGVKRDTFEGKIISEKFVLLLLNLKLIGWVSNQTSESVFRELFSGKSSDCEIVWTGKQGLGTLKKLFNAMLIQKLIDLPAGARSVNSVIENHFVDKNGCFLTGLNKSKESGADKQRIESLIREMKEPVSENTIKERFKEYSSSKDPSYR